MATRRKLFACRRIQPHLVSSLLTAVLGLGAPAGAFAQQRPILDIPSTPLPQRTWVDVNGKPLPFYNDEQIQDLLRDARVIERKHMPIGVTDPERVLLEKDGIRVHGVFRYVDTVYNNVRMQDGRRRTNLRDSCQFEAAAYELSRLLGLDVVPPVVTRRIGNDNGTLQIFVYNAVMENERVEQGMSPPSVLGWRRQAQQMYAFDALIGNDDRTQQNVLIDKNFKLWLIDHTRAFYRYADMATLQQVQYIEREFWERMQALDKETLERVVGPYLTEADIDALLERRDKVVVHIQALIDEKGEEAVIFEWGPPQH